MTCEVGQGVEAFAIKYNHSWVISSNKRIGILKPKFAHLNFRVRDSTGCFHLHIAACNDNTELLEYLIMEDIDHSTFTCDNGSTPLHSAIQCKAGSAFIWLLSKMNIFNSVWNFRKLKTLVWYIMHSTFNGTVIQNIDNLHTLNIITKHLLNVSSFNRIDEFDSFNRTIMFYILKYGHVEYLSDLMAERPDETVELLLMRDFFGNSPLTYALRSLLNPTHVIIDVREFMHQRFNDSVDEMLVLSPTEYAIASTSVFMLERNLLTKTDILRALKIIIKKKNFNLARFFIKNVFAYSDVVQTKTLQMFLNHDESALLTLNYLLFINKNILQNNITVQKSVFLCLTCKEMLSRCMNHKLAEKHLLMQHYFKHILEIPSFDVFTELIFNPVLMKRVSSCVDKKGHNLLDIAIMTGNTNLSVWFLKKGWKSTLSITDIMHTTIFGEGTTSELTPLIITEPFYISESNKIMKVSFFNSTILRKQYAESSIYNITELSSTTLKLLQNKVNYKKFTTLTMLYFEKDVFLSELMNNSQLNISVNSICRVNSYNFSLAHLLALSGYTSTLKVLVRLFGRDILNCSNKHKFTPLYMAGVFGMQET
ncbi:uncharacterized protein LOC127868592 isoform X2 [Dreissena polymorpha]|nr:uncharacterized protein LOC127868592 isoform X2 [Dreissena polymorpha]